LSPKYPHLLSAAIAVLLTLGTVIYGTVYAQSLEQKYIHVLAPLMLPQGILGSALQQAGFQQSDLLMVYGSSEMLVGDVINSKQHASSTIILDNTTMGASQFFQNYPSGFDVYEIAHGGVTSLDIAQDLAAIGPELRGKKVVISFTPTMFIAYDVSPDAYAADFSTLHANALIFNPNLSLATKQMAARRLNDYPDTLMADPILQFAIQQLNCSCGYGPMLYDLTWPLGQFNIWIIRLEDHWEVVNYITRHPSLSARVIREPEQINWSNEFSQALISEKMDSSNNSYGIRNDKWDAEHDSTPSFPIKPGSDNLGFLQNIAISKEWVDFDLLLQVLKELGAQPLILSRPLNGPFLDMKGITWQARQEYYVRLQNAVSAYGFPVVDFVNQDSNRYFSIDRYSHTSPVGWVYTDQVLDAFFHGTIH
jgi:D-alanine transfer protein